MENFEERHEIEKKERQLDNLINIKEKHTRTQRHLEQYSEIGDKDNKDNARRKQQIREKEMEELKSKITDEDKYISPEEHLENVKENYNNTESYIENNKESIDNQMLRNLQEKQEHREEQIIYLEDES